ncbi:peptidase M64 N-terminal domain-containing protein, partial [Alloprevotella tannerae]
MKRIFALAGLLLLIMASIHAQQLNLNQTLRIDYIFSGDVQRREIAVSELNTFDGWYGRHVNLDTLALQGNGKIYLRDAHTKRLLYCNSFSTLF